MAGLVLLGFTAVYREGFEVVLSSRTCALSYGAAVVLEGVGHRPRVDRRGRPAHVRRRPKLPYKKMLVLPRARRLASCSWLWSAKHGGARSSAGWLPTTTLGFTLPGWMGTWLAIFPTVETLAAQALAAGAVIGSYLLAEHVRMRRPQRLGEQAASGPSRRRSASPSRYLIEVDSTAARGRGINQSLAPTALVAPRLSTIQSVSTKTGPKKIGNRSTSTCPMWPAAA